MQITKKKNIKSANHKLLSKTEYAYMKTTIYKGVLSWRTNMYINGVESLFLVLFPQNN